MKTVYPQPSERRIYGFFHLAAYNFPSALTRLSFDIKIISKTCHIKNVQYLGLDVSCRYLALICHLLHDIDKHSQPCAGDIVEPGLPPITNP